MYWRRSWGSIGVLTHGLRIMERLLENFVVETIIESLETSAPVGVRLCGMDLAYIKRGG